MYKIATYLLFSLLFISHIGTLKNLSLKYISPSKKVASTQQITPGVDIDALRIQVLPAGGIKLPILWGDLGKKMIRDSVIDEAKFRAIFPEGFSEKDEILFSGNFQDQVILSEDNGRLLLDLLWAFGLANTNKVLSAGEIADSRIGKTANYASTGGWNLAKGDVMEHFNSHTYVTLTKDQQIIVDRVSGNIYRPCCNNSTHFPDCNHGMAMLGLLELMAAANVPEPEMYAVALKVNSFWFPQTYLDLATYFKEQGQEWQAVDPKLILSKQYSSATGYANTRKLIKSLPGVDSSGGGCGA